MVALRDKLYLPAVRAKQGELRAINSLGERNLEQTLPLILFDGGLANTRDQVTRNLRSDIPMNLLLDLRTPLTRGFIREMSESFPNHSGSPKSFGFSIPETTMVTDFDQLLRESKSSFSAVHLRLQDGRPQSGTAQQILALSKVASTYGNDFSLILDFGYISSPSVIDSARKLANDVLISIRNKGVSFNRVFILSGSFPRQISWVDNTASKPPKNNDPFSTERLELTLTNLLREDNLDWIELLFGDYSIFHASEIVNRGNQQYSPAPNIRYAQDSKWILLRGKAKENEGFYTLCSQLMHQCEVDPPDFSYGDSVFNSRAEGNGGPGGGSQWLEWSSSHHLAFTIRQLSNLGVI